MPVDDSAEILQELCGLIHDELKALSYKWVARHYSISSNNAKRVLFQLAEQQRDKVRTVYLVSGWTKQEPPSHVHQLVEADQLQLCRESLREVTGMHVYSVAPNQATNPDSLWQVTYQQSQQLLKEIMSGQPSASAEVFRNNSCSAVRCVAPSPQQSQQQRPPTAAAPSAPTAKAAPPTVQPQPPQHPESRAKPPAGDSAAGSAAAPQAAANANGTFPADSSAKAAGASPPRTAGPSPPKAAAGKAPGKAAGPATAKSNTLANMWSKGPAKSKAAAAAAAAPSAEVSPGAVLAQEHRAGGKEEEEEDEEEEGMPVHVGAGRNRGRKRRGAQIDDSEDEAGKEPAMEARGIAAAPPAATVGASDQPDQQKQGRGGKGAKAKGAGKTMKEEKAKPSGAKRAKTVSETDAPLTAPAAVTETAASGGDEVEVDEAVVGALETAAAVAPQQLQQQQQSAPMKSTGAAAGRGEHARKVIRTYINDEGEEVTEEVWEDGPTPPQPQQQQQPPAVHAAVAATGPAKGLGAAAAATKPAAKGPAPSSKAAKGKAPAAGQKSMTAFFSKK